jgi:Tfp pilus assembly protein FimT
MVSLDPFINDPPMFSAVVPLFLLVLLVLIVGVILGGVSAWMRQSRWRSRARRLSGELRAARAQAEALRRQLESATQPRPSGSIAAIAYRHPDAA